MQRVTFKYVDGYCLTDSFNKDTFLCKNTKLNGDSKECFASCSQFRYSCPSKDSERDEVIARIDRYACFAMCGLMSYDNNGNISLLEIAEQSYRMAFYMERSREEALTHIEKGQS